MEYMYMGTYADVLEGGRPVAPRDVVDLDTEGVQGNKRLIDDGLLISTGKESQSQLAGQTLQERATALKIDGRTNMNANELRAAVEEAEEN